MILNNFLTMSAGTVENTSTNYFQDLADRFYRNFIFENRWQMLLKGLGTTLEITFFAIILGTVLGFLLAIMRLSQNKLARGVSGVYLTVIRGTPLVTQLLITYFVIFASVNVSKVVIAICAFGLNSGAYVAEIIRSGIQAVDKGQSEAGRSLGLSKTQTMRYIILPQAIKNVLPAYVNEFVVLVKETAIVGYIALEDLTKMGDIIRGKTFDALMPLLAVAFVYLCLTTLIIKVFNRVERRLKTDDKG